MVPSSTHASSQAHGSSGPLIDVISNVKTHKWRWNSPRTRSCILDAGKCVGCSRYQALLTWSTMNPTSNN